MPLIPPIWHTERITVRDAVLEQVPRLTALVNACSYVGAWDDTFSGASEEEVAGLVRESMAARDGAEERFTMQSLYAPELQELVGYYHIMYDRPQPAQVGISILVIDPGYQGHRYGSEIVEGLAHNLAALGCYDTLLARVYLKNWPAMRFWVKMGFTGIVRYEGDPVLAEGAYASLLLERRLR